MRMSKRRYTTRRNNQEKRHFRLLLWENQILPNTPKYMVSQAFYDDAVFWVVVPCRLMEYDDHPDDGTLVNLPSKIN